MAQTGHPEPIPRAWGNVRFWQTDLNHMARLLPEGKPVLLKPVD